MSAAAAAKARAGRGLCFFRPKKSAPTERQISNMECFLLYNSGGNCR
jgi:hypothetical protein